MPTQDEPQKRIAVVIPKYGLTGGAERFAANLTERLAHNPAYDIHVFANRWNSLSKTISLHHVPIISFPRFLTSLSFAWCAWRLLRRGQYDIIHTHDRIFHADLFSMHGVPHRFWRREIRRKPMGLTDRMTAWLEDRLVRDPGCRYLLPVSSLALSHYRQQFPEADNRLQVVHPGIDLERFSPNSRIMIRQDIRARYRIGAPDFVVLFVGMNFELKGLATLIAAVAQARKNSPGGRPITLLVAGKGDRRRFGRLAAHYGIQQAVIFAGEQGQGIEDFYAAADVHALLSGFDTFGMTVLEAMASGLPVIISQNVGAKDLVIDGVHGYIVDGKQSEEVADRIVALLQLNEQQHQTMAQATRAVAESHSWDKVTQKVSQLYDTILAGQ